MIYLIRHGQTDWNIDKKIQGQTDIPLNENGKLQAKNISEDISKLKIDRIISSDLSRAKETANIINENIGVKIDFDKRLREVGYGDLEGTLVDTLTEETWDIFNKTPEKLNGETRVEVYKRIKSFFDELKREDGNTLVVTHGGAIRMIRYYADNRDEFNIEKYMNYTRDMKVDNATVLELKI